MAPFFLSKEFAQKLKPEDFKQKKHAEIYQACLNLVEQRKPTEFQHVLAELVRDETKTGISELIDVCSKGEIPSLLPYHANEIFQHAIKQKLGEALEEGSKELELSTFEEVFERIKNSGEKLSERAYDTEDIPLREAIKEEGRRIEACHDSGGITGLSSGFKDLDYYTGGFQRGDLTIIAGRPSMGKTALALAIGIHVAENDVPVGVFSLEMSVSQLVQRALASEGRIDGNKIRKGNLSESEFGKLITAMGKISDLPIYLCGKPSISLSEMSAKVRRWKASHQVGLIIVDYLQLMQVDADSREQEIAKASRTMKLIANEMNIPVIALSQLNRGLESREDKRPRLSDLRESGSIEQDADLVLFVYRGEVYKRVPENEGLAEIIIGKQRNGPLGTVTLKFWSECTRFDDLAKTSYTPEAKAS